MKCVLKVLRSSDHKDADSVDVIGLHCEMLLNGKQYLFSLYEDMDSLKRRSLRIKNNERLSSINLEYLKNVYFPNFNSYEEYTVKKALRSFEELYYSVFILKMEHLTFEVI